MSKGKKKKSKNKKLITKILKISSIVVAGIFVAVIAYNLIHPKYMNNYKVRCSRGYHYYSSVFCILGCGCEECPVGSYCPGDDHAYRCPNSDTTTRIKKADSIGQCKYCKDETKYYNGSSCVTCPKGSYCTGGEKHNCPTGTTTDGTGKKNASDCKAVKCSKSQYLNSNGKCETCPKNYYCDGKVKTYCGNYEITASTGNTSKKACVCKSGYYRNGSFCIICEKGKKCVNEKMTACSGTNEYQNETGKSTCKKCGSNQKPNDKHTSCVAVVKTCKQGEYNNNGICVICPKGYKCDGKVKTLCTGTDKYQDKTGQTACKTCSNNLVASSNHDKCVCPKGKYDVNGTCKVCPKGYMCANGNKTLCSGTKSYQDKTGQSSCKECSGKKVANKNHTGCK